MSRRLPVSVTPVLRRLPLPLFAAVLLVGTLLGAAGTLRSFSEPGLLLVPVVESRDDLANAAATIELRLQSGLAYRALQQPMVNGVPVDDAGLGAFMTGVASATGGYQAVELLSAPATATIDAPGDRALFAYDVLFLGDSSATIRRAAAAKQLVWADSPSATGMGIDVLTVRSIPTLLRSLSVEHEEPVPGGGTRLSGTAPAYTYPGAVGSDLLPQTAATLVVLVELDANDHLVRFLIRARNVVIDGVDYVTEVVLESPGEPPSWVAGARP